MKTMFDMLASDRWAPLAKSKFTKRIGDFDNLCDELWYFIRKRPKKTYCGD